MTTLEALIVIALIVVVAVIMIIGLVATPPDPETCWKRCEAKCTKIYGDRNGNPITPMRDNQAFIECIDACHIKCQ